MSLDITLMAVQPVAVFDWNITHNLGPMAREAGIYQHLWRPEELGIGTAAELIAPLTSALALLRAEPDRFKALNPENKWGSYEGLVACVEAYLDACSRNPGATLSISR